MQLSFLQNREDIFSTKYLMHQIHLKCHIIEPWNEPISDTDLESNFCLSVCLSVCLGPLMMCDEEEEDEGVVAVVAELDCVIVVATAFCFVLLRATLVT